MHEAAADPRPDGSPLVSVIIPTFNRANLVSRAVESALSQSYSSVEVIVVDDGSTDQTAAVLAEFGDRIISLRQRNAGVCAARNAGIDVAQGKFIAFLDSDDLWRPWKLAAQMAAFARFPELQLSYTDGIAVDDLGREIHQAHMRKSLRAYSYFTTDELFDRHLPLRELAPTLSGAPPEASVRVGDFSSAIFMGNLMMTPTVVFRRELIQRFGKFDGDIGDAGEDYDLFVRLCQGGPVALIDAPATEIRQGQDNHLHSQRVKMALANLTTLGRFQRSARGELRLPAGLQRQRWRDSFAWAGTALFDEGRPDEARSYLWQAMKAGAFGQRIALYWLLSLLPYTIVDHAREWFAAAKATWARRS